MAACTVLPRKRAMSTPLWTTGTALGDRPVSSMSASAEARELAIRLSTLIFTAHLISSRCRRPKWSHETIGAHARPWVCDAVRIQMRPESRPFVCEEHNIEGLGAGCNGAGLYHAAAWRMELISWLRILWASMTGRCE